MAAFLTYVATFAQRVPGVLGTVSRQIELPHRNARRKAVDRFVRCLDLAAFNGFDQRRIEVIFDRLTPWHEAWPPVDTTLVSLLTLNSQAREGGSVVLEAEVEGRWCEETALFL